MTNPVLPLRWVACGGAVAAAAVSSRRHVAALRRGRYAVAALFIAAGAAVNLFLVVTDRAGYAKFAEGSYLAFVRDTWASLVVPHTTAWIALLIVFELAVGLAALRGGTTTQFAYAAAIAFHVALLSFGIGFYFWSLPMLAALFTLWRGERRANAAAGAPQRPQETAAADRSPTGNGPSRARRRRGSLGRATPPSRTANS
jgi:hypothetical protein